jgi:hypothetical protein
VSPCKHRHERAELERAGHIIGAVKWRYLAMLGVLVVPAVLAATRRATATGHVLPDVTVLFARALNVVRSDPQFRHATLLEADGATAAPHAAISAAGVVRWTFMFQSGRANSATASVSLGYDAHGFGRPVGHAAPVLEDVPLRTAPAMPLESAVLRLRSAAFGGAFSAVTLRIPLGPNASSTPLYIFTVGNRFVSVNTATGNVARVR